MRRHGKLETAGTSIAVWLRLWGYSEHQIGSAHAAWLARAPPDNMTSVSLDVNADGTLSAHLRAEWRVGLHLQSMALALPPPAGAALAEAALPDRPVDRRPRARNLRGVNRPAIEADGVVGVGVGGTPPAAAMVLNPTVVVVVTHVPTHVGVPTLVAMLSRYGAVSNVSIVSNVVDGRGAYLVDLIPPGLAAMAEGAGHVGDVADARDAEGAFLVPYARLLAACRDRVAAAGDSGAGRRE
jgi:hypothetical protein